ELDVLRRMIDDDAHRAFGGMRADIDERTRETLVQHGRHGDQHLAVQIAPDPTLPRCAARHFHGGKVSLSIRFWKRTAAPKVQARPAGARPRQCRDTAGLWPFCPSRPPPTVTIMSLAISPAWP